MVFTLITLSAVIVALLGATAFFMQTSRKLYEKLKDAEEIMEAKNDALREYIENVSEYHNKLWEAEHKLAKLTAATAKRKPGRPKGSKNKAFSQKKFDLKYGK